MFDENQIVQIKWNNTNREWYESKGYIYTKRYDSFDVLAKDLSHRSNAKINAVCDYCNNKYEACFVVLMDGRKFVKKDCCPNCTGKKTSEVSWRKRAEKYIGLAQDVCDKSKYILITTIDEYVDVKMDIEFVCPKHGNQTMVLDNFIRGHKCKSCSYEKRGENLRHNVEHIKKCIEDVNGNKLLNPEDYKDAHTRNLNIKCSCGKIFTTSFANYNNHGVNTCFSCSCKESSGEQRIRKFLESMDIDFEQEKRFNDCCDIKPLPFDFYLQRYNLIIEFDGKHHFEEIGLRNHESTREHDEIKNQYCKDNGIDLLRIPYWDGNDIENIILEKLNL